MNIDKTVTNDELIESLQDLYDLVNVRDVYGRLRSGSRDKFHKARNILIKLGRIKND